MSAVKVTVLLQVVERETGLPLLPVEEREGLRNSWDSDSVIEDRAKRCYLADIETLVKHVPSKRKALYGKKWYIDATVV